VGSAFELPFEDNSFDVVFSHTTMSHLDHRRALPEAVRVLKPGGMLAVRDFINDGWFLHPMTPTLRGAQELMWRARAEVEKGSNRNLGKEFRGLFFELGLVDIEATASCLHFGTPTRIRPYGEAWTSFFSASRFVDEVLSAGFADRERLSEMSKAFAAWANDPTAFAMMPMGECTGYKPKAINPIGAR
jgi:ubiquinone/menaquinone biosynthesis C-methylase UbiE